MKNMHKQRIFIAKFDLLDPDLDPGGNLKTDPKH